MFLIELSYPSSVFFLSIWTRVKLTIGSVPPSILSPWPGSAELAERAVEAEPEEQPYSDNPTNSTKNYAKQVGHFQVLWFCNI